MDISKIICIFALFMKREIKFLVERLVRQEISQLIEYAHPRKDYIFRVEHLMKQIIIHLCLILHNRFIGNEDYISHWKNELFGWINTLSNLDIKNGNTTTKRLNAIHEALNNMEYLTNINKIKSCVVPKAREENMDINSDAMNYAVVECQNKLREIADIIANNNMLTCHNFVENL